MNTYYGSFRTRTFYEIFPDLETFREALNETPFKTILQTSGEEPAFPLDIVYGLLFARYGNSHSAFSSEAIFRSNIFSTLFMYGPSWSKRLQIQQKVRQLNEEEAIIGHTEISNHAENPNTVPTTQTTEELDYINAQNVRKQRRNKLEGYASVLALVEADVTEEFINKFRKFFIQIIAPDTPLLYRINESDYEITEKEDTTL